MVKKIAVFGGTGMTGQSVVEYALSQGEQKRETLLHMFRKKEHVWPTISLMVHRTMEMWNQITAICRL